MMSSFVQFQTQSAFLFSINNFPFKMKLVLIVLTFFAYGCVAEEEAEAEGKVLFSACPDFKIVYPEFKARVDIANVLGPWNMIRHNCPDPARADQIDCIQDLYYIDDKTPAGSVNWVMHARNGTNHKTSSGLFHYTGLEGDMVDNLFDHNFTLPEAELNITVHSQSALIDSDDGESWGLFVSCIELEPNNRFVEWVIFSRYAWIDAKLEQRLVEQIEKYGGVPPKALRGIGQTDCFKHPKHKN